MVSNPGRNFKTFERFELLQLRNIFHGHAANNLRRDRVADPDGLVLDFFAVAIVNFAGDLNFRTTTGF